MVVPNAAIEPTPCIATATAIAISKWLDDPIITVIIASLYFNLNNFVTIRLNPTTIANPIKRGIEIKINKSGFAISTSPFNENNVTKVISRAKIAILETTGR